MFSIILDFLLTEFRDHPIHIAVEALLICVAVYFLWGRPYNPRKPREAVDEEYIIQNEWHPETLVLNEKTAPVAVVEDSDEDSDDEPPIIEAVTPTTVTVDGVECRNHGSFNFLGLSASQETKDVAHDAVNYWGVGTCGPRGFYGTIQPHVELEEQLAAWYGTEKAIIYSYGYATVSSVIHCYSTRGDVIVADTGVSQSLQNGIWLSRSETKWFKHNDMEDLDKVLTAVTTNVQRKKKQKKQEAPRLWIIVEGVYRDHGDICKLKDVITLAKKYKFRILLDDSFGIGVLGKNGKGIVDHVGADMKDVTLYTASFSMALGSVGGFCVGATQAVEHQRLSSSGYCYSASLPAFLTLAASHAIKYISKDPSICEKLRLRINFTHNLLAEQHAAFVMEHEPPAPIFHLRAPKELGRKREDRVMREIVRQTRKAGVAVVRSRYVPSEMFQPRPSIRFTIAVGHSDEDIKSAVQALAAAFQEAVRAEEAKKKE